MAHPERRVVGKDLNARRRVGGEDLGQIKGAGLVFHGHEIGGLVASFHHRGDNFASPEEAHPELGPAPMWA